MQHLHILNPRLITYKDDGWVIDVLGGVDLQSIERMIVTLRISYKEQSPFRTTIDLYNGAQFEKLIRSLCDRWELKLSGATACLNSLILELEEYRLQAMSYTGKGQEAVFSSSPEEQKKAVQVLKSKNLSDQIIRRLKVCGIVGDDVLGLILFFTLASYKSAHPFAVLCLSKGIGNSYLLHRLSSCMPEGTYSYHTEISANALYYMDNRELHHKALLIEDLEWTSQMLSPLAALQTQGRLVKTRATKDKDGKLHSTTFEVNANVCLLACVHSVKVPDMGNAPFLCVSPEHQEQYHSALVEYLKQCKAGLISVEQVRDMQQELKQVIAALDRVRVLNPYATLINLPDTMVSSGKIMLLLNFIEVITYCFQHQRAKAVDKHTTGEISVQTHPDDIALALTLLRGSLFKKADTLSPRVSVFWDWLSTFLQGAQTTQFTALDIRKERSLHPRTLNRYLQELKLFSYIRILGGNKHREGFTYQLTGFQGGSADHLEEAALQGLMQSIRAEHANREKQSKSVGQKALSKLQK